jgi:hypothetical protein
VKVEHPEYVWGVITLEDWAEIRRLHRSEKVPQAAIARRLGIARNTVAKALASERPPKYERAPAGSLVDAVEPRIRLLLAEHPSMPATVIAERIGWVHSLTILKDRVRLLRPLFVGVDPADRVQYAPGEIAQCDLWFPPVPIPVGGGQERVLPVLAMTCGYSRTTAGVMLPSRKAGDVLAGMWALLGDWGCCPRTLVWDREAAAGGASRDLPGHRSTLLPSGVWARSGAAFAVPVERGAHQAPHRSPTPRILGPTSAGRGGEERVCPGLHVRRTVPEQKSAGVDGQVQVEVGSEFVDQVSELVLAERVAEQVRAAQVGCLPERAVTATSCQ